MKAEGKTSWQNETSTFRNHSWEILVANGKFSFISSGGTVTTYDYCVVLMYLVACKGPDTVPRNL